MNTVSDLYSLGHVVYQTSLPSGEVEVLVNSAVRACGQALMLQTEIVVEGFGASKRDLAALRRRVAPHLQGGWRPHCRPDSWIGVVYGDVENAKDAIKALGVLRINLEWSDFDDVSDLYRRRSDTLRAELQREAHEAMNARSLGCQASPTGIWALENSGAL
ncbi:MAG: hypothetical protein E6Q97_23775 [Desulfurellales bacterium]|nr:MAG: hypothetical protein E6Q97_23775 [Desulfurellales bacterium]